MRRWSYPVWVRGLKQPAPIACTRPAGVVPRVGAWIETCMYICKTHSATVVPRVGAWIETIGICYVGGLDAVVPRVGAWIETEKIV
mgnify:CR=1 FL=1